MLDRASVPRRALDIEDYISMVRRNFRWLLAPLFAGLVLSTVVAYLWKDTYVSEALIRIVPQQISPEVVPDITAQDISDRINSMAQSIESHNTLSTIVTSFGLYPKELKKEPMEDVIADMKAKAIKIKPVEGVTSISGKDLPAMQVSFKYQDPAIAQKVCADIVSRFMDANTTEQLQTQQQANTFISDEFKQATHDLDVADQKLADFRTKNAGRLPDQMQTNLAQMGALEQRGANVNDAQDRNAQQRMMLQAQLEMAQDRLKSIRSLTQAQSQKVSDLDREIDQMETNISSLKLRYTDANPDLQAAQDRLGNLRKEREEAAKEKPKTDANPSENAAVSRERQEAQAVVKQIQVELDGNKMEASRIQKQNTQVTSALSGYQGRLQGLPADEKELAELMRDRELIKMRYDKLEQQLQRSASSIELNRRKQGQTLEVLDTASLPTTPSEPKRLVIVPIGAVIGLVIGLIIVGMREMKDTSLKSLKDARLYTQLSVLGSIPLLENDVVVQRRKQFMWVSWAAGTAVGLAIMAVSVLHYYMSKA